MRSLLSIMVPMYVSSVFVFKELQSFFLSLFQVGEVVGANEQAIRGEIKKNQ